MKKPPLVAVVGPTASGKTALSIEICKEFDGEVVSADSMQIYKFMDIGTAKPPLEERQGIPHYLIDEVMPDYNFSVADYKSRAMNYISQIHSKGKLPVLVGGTGLYVDNLVNNIELCDIESNLELRSELNELAENKGNDYIYNMLSELDPEMAATLHPNNVKRVIRAIEVYKLTGKSMLWHNEHSKGEPLYDAILFMPDWDREKLYERINKRVDIMINSRLVQEVEKLLFMGYGKGTTSIQAIGYKEIIAFLNGKISLDEATDTIKQASRNYAKRQLTWFRRNKNIILLNPEDDMVEQCRNYINNWLNK